MAWRTFKEERMAFLSTRVKEPNLKTIISDRKYIAGTIFVLMAALINQG